MLKSMFATVLVLLCWAGPSHADIFGTADNGRRVILRDNRTWDYVGTSASTCRDYARQAVADQRANRSLRCGINGPAWHTNVAQHVRWCERVARQERLAFANARTRALAQCRAKNAQCRAYAQNAVAQQQKNLAGNCGIVGPVWHLDADAHITWCMATNGSRRNAVTRARASRLAQCTTVQCRAYARSAVAQQQKNLDLNCGIAGPAWHRDFARHVEWCRTAPKTRRDAFTRARRDRLAQCRNVTPPRRAIYLGCFVDRNQRDLAGFSFGGGSMTVQSCIRACRDRGFAFAGVQYRSQCFCGNTYGTYGRARAADCNLPCTGNANQTCGGTWRNSIYRIR